MTEPKVIVGGNGHGKWHVDISHWPVWMQAAYVSIRSFGAFATVLMAGVGVYAWYQIKVATPEAEARLSLLTQTSNSLTKTVETQEKQAELQNKLCDNVRDVATLVKTVTENETKMLENDVRQTQWMDEWKAYISAQHEARAIEAKAIQTWQMQASDFFKRTDETHAEMVAKQVEEAKAMRDLCDTIRELCEEIRSKNRPAAGPKAPPKDSAKSNG